MYYKMTQLKDLPDSPAGTVFYCKEDKGLKWYRPGLYLVAKEGDVSYVEKDMPLFDNPAWFKKEVDLDSTSDLKCPKCGDTRGSFFSKEWYVRDMDSDDYGVQFSVGIECICGHRRVLYGTRRGNERLREIIGRINHEQGLDA